MKTYFIFGVAMAQGDKAGRISVRIIVSHVRFSMESESGEQAQSMSAHRHHAEIFSIFTLSHKTWKNEMPAKKGKMPEFAPLLSFCRRPFLRAAGNDCPPPARNAPAGWTLPRIPSTKTRYHATLA